MASKVRRSANNQRSNKELGEASKHIFWGMRYLSERLQFILKFTNSKREDEIQGILNSIHESFLIHSRKMCDFLFRTSEFVYEDDVIGQDYFSDYRQWKEILPSVPPVIDDMRKNVGKLLAHFTYSLIDHPAGRITWKTSDIYVEIFEFNYIEHAAALYIDNRTILRGGKMETVPPSFPKVCTRLETLRQIAELLN